ncbi:hypothetical protein NDS46_12455 [Paenibacillus thiaminolyticus]|uniref:hypothetical protein n=1 Tax=Paenibacillus thiaminolyticus TaxID=49283 RepID=UPI00232E4536|nr:hypothetical protein [Paenibacillus thiaminolyticus]WCF10596.1 hypothetical protein NDS46_12455 [Paenibacillus thiaminolyticus]
MILIFTAQDYGKSEYYSRLYTQYDYPHIKTNSVLMGPLLNAKKGNSDAAVARLTSFLETCSQDAALHAINQLLPLYLQESRLDEAGQLIDYPICTESISANNPITISQLAEYYYHRSEYFITVGDIQKGVADLLERAWYFSKVTMKKNAETNQTVH